jgi:RES domain-containing protein
LKLWRVSDYVNLSGDGGLHFAGRWHSGGREVVYTAEHSALALLEILVHLERRVFPPPFRLIEIHVPLDLKVARFSGVAPQNFADSQEWGDKWLASGDTALAKVPSAVAPDAFNYLFNPRHQDASRVKILRHAVYPWDARLFP